MDAQVRRKDGLMNLRNAEPSRRVSLLIRRHSTNTWIKKVPEFYHIKQQLAEQLKCLDIRVDQLTSIVTEIQDFFRRRAEVEMEYARGLDKLVKSTLLKHKAEKQKRSTSFRNRLTKLAQPKQPDSNETRDQWQLFSAFTCWQTVLSQAKQQSRDHAVLSEIYSTQLTTRLADISEDMQRLHKKCREVAAEEHEELLKVLNELQMSLKSYHTYQTEHKHAEIKLRNVEQQKQKLEQSMSTEKLAASRKVRLLRKETTKRESKFAETRLKALKARNEYLLCVESANAAVQKYYVDDISDLIDSVDFGFHNSVARALMMHISCDESLKRSLEVGIDAMDHCIRELDARADKDRFLEAYRSAFLIPTKFTYKPHKDDEITQFLMHKSMQEEVDQRYRQLCARLMDLRTESEEIWKTLESTETALMNIVNICDYNCYEYFAGQRRVESTARNREQRLETESFYLKKFREYIQNNNLVARLKAKHAMIEKHMQVCVDDNYEKPPVSKHKKCKAGQHKPNLQPKLFGGSLLEYVEATGQDVPQVVQSCIRTINIHGLHQQGIFRVSGSQVEVNELRNLFEKGEDPLTDAIECNDVNSVAGLLKMYLRELREPLLPAAMFDQFVKCAFLEPTEYFVERVRSLLLTLPRPVFVVLRYLFAFLNHLSEFSDENMMEPYNLAICFGPTLLPMPSDTNQSTVHHQSAVNALVKNMIVHQEEIFPRKENGILYEKFFIPIAETSQSDMQDTSRNSGSESDTDSGDEEIVDAIAQFDFDGRSERELTFRKGAAINLHNQVSSDWWEGSIEGKAGLVPDKYIAVTKMREKADNLWSSDSNRRTNSNVSSSMPSNHSSPSRAVARSPPSSNVSDKTPPCSPTFSNILVGASPYAVVQIVEEKDGSPYAQLVSSNVDKSEKYASNSRHKMSDSGQQNAYKDRTNFSNSLNKVQMHSESMPCTNVSTFSSGKKTNDNSKHEHSYSSPALMKDANELKVETSLEELTKKLSRESLSIQEDDLSVTSQNAVDRKSSCESAKSKSDVSRSELDEEHKVDKLTDAKGKTSESPKTDSNVVLRPHNPIKGLYRDSMVREFDNVMASVKSDIEYIESKSQSNSRKGSACSLSTDQPDLVCDLPIITSASPSKFPPVLVSTVAPVGLAVPIPKRHSPSPVLTAADAFAKSGQSTLKKGEGASLSISRSTPTSLELGNDAPIVDHSASLPHRISRSEYGKLFRSQSYSNELLSAETSHISRTLSNLEIELGMIPNVSKDKPVTFIEKTKPDASTSLPTTPSPDAARKSPMQLRRTQSEKQTRQMTKRVQTYRSKIQ